MIRAVFKRLIFSVRPSPFAYELRAGRPAVESKPVSHYVSRLGWPSDTRSLPALEYAKEGIRFNAVVSAD
jgi:hypothetical protein